MKVYHEDNEEIGNIEEEEVPIKNNEVFDCEKIEVNKVVENYEAQKIEAGIHSFNFHDPWKVVEPVDIKRL